MSLFRKTKGEGLYYIQLQKIRGAIVLIVFTAIPSELYRKSRTLLERVKCPSSKSSKGF